MNEKFNEAMEAWDKVTNNLSEYGAADSEPTGVLEYIIEKKINEDVDLLPLTSRRWQLYDGSDSEVAYILNKAAQEILDVIDSLKFSEVREIAEYYGF
jgi:hypothetical protein